MSLNSSNDVGDGNRSIIVTENDWVMLKIPVVILINEKFNEWEANSTNWIMIGYILLINTKNYKMLLSQIKLFILSYLMNYNL